MLQERQAHPVLVQAAGQGATAHSHAGESAAIRTNRRAAEQGQQRALHHPQAGHQQKNGVPLAHPPVEKEKVGRQPAHLYLQNSTPRIFSATFRKNATTLRVVRGKDECYIANTFCYIERTF